MDREGFVIKAEGPNVTVRFRRISGCGENCAHCNACGGQYEDLELQTNMKLEAGDKVVVSSPQGTIYFGLFFLFVLPVVFPLAAYILFTSQVGKTAGWIAAAAAIVLWLIGVFLLNRSGRFARRSRPRIVGKATVKK